MEFHKESESVPAVPAIGLAFSEAGLFLFLANNQM